MRFREDFSWNGILILKQFAISWDFYETAVQPISALEVVFVSFTPKKSLTTLLKWRSSKIYPVSDLKSP